jgi:hypothetical protein
LRRNVNAISCSRSASLNTNCALGLPLIPTSPCRGSRLHDEQRQ